MRAYVLVVLVASVALAGCTDDVTDPDLTGQDDGPDTVAGQTRPDGLATTAAVEPKPLVRPSATAAGPLDFEHLFFEMETAIYAGEASHHAYPVTLEGSLHIPQGNGTHALIVLMHGRHGTCEILGMGEILGAPCPDASPATSPVDSFRGYDYLAENLASHGYVVASLSANHINDRDNDFGLMGALGTGLGDDFGATARARIILTFLDDVAAVQDGSGPDELRSLEGRVDMDRIGLMGHSRGGEGVARAVGMNQEWPTPHALRAVFALAPIDFDRQVVLGVPFAVLLPYCDGDVSNLQGAWIYDDNRYSAGAGPMHQFLTLGANHNWYNTIWTGSDWTNRGDPHCDLDADDSGRLTFEQQTTEGLAVMASFLRAYTGPEPGLLPYTTGEWGFEQPGIITSYHPPTDDRFVLYGDGSDHAVEWTLATDQTTCRLGDCPIERQYSSADNAYFAWSELASVAITAEPFDAWAFDRISLRIGLDHDGEARAGGLTVVVAGTDGTGRVAITDLGEQGWFDPPGESGAKTTLNMVAIPMEAFGPSIGPIERVEVHFTGSGAAVINDIMFQRLP